MPAQEPPPLTTITPDIQARLDGNNSHDTLPNPVFATPPIEPIREKTTIISPDKGTQPPAKPSSTGDDLSAFEDTLGIKLDTTQQKQNEKLPTIEEVVAPATPKKAPVAEPVKKVEALKEATAEETKQEEKKDFKFDPFKSAKKEVAKQSEPKEEEEPEAPPVQQPFQAPAKKRDYTGLTEEEVARFKKVGNESYDYFRQQHEELKRLREIAKNKSTTKDPSVPESYFAHPEAHTLLPEFKQVVQLEQRANIENRFWQQQLAKIRNGEDWNELAVDERGQYVLGDKRKADSVAEAEIVNNLTKTNTVLSQARGQVQYMQQTASSIYQQAEEEVKKAANNYMPFYAQEDNPHRERIANIQKAFPAPFQNHPVTGFASKLAVMAQELHAQLEEAHKEIALLRSSRQESANRQPNNKQLGAAISQDHKGVNKKPSVGDDIEALNKMLGENLIPG